MGLLDSQTQKILVESMRHSLTESVQKNQELTESAQVATVKFVKESATYEQLLNLTLNPLFESKYLPTHVLEGAFAIASEAMLTGRKVIGPNAIAEGAKNLIKKTDCVITESMLDAADVLVQSKGLNVVANTITEAVNLGSIKKTASDVLTKAKDVVKTAASKAKDTVTGLVNKGKPKTTAKPKPKTTAKPKPKTTAKPKPKTTAKPRVKEMPDTSMKTNADTSKKTAMDWLKKKLGK